MRSLGPGPGRGASIPTGRPVPARTHTITTGRPHGGAMARKRQVFAVTTPLGYRVVLTRDRWREITRFKHPAVAGHEVAVRECVRDPVAIRASVKDAAVHLYYRPVSSGFVCVVV